MDFDELQNLLTRQPTGLSPKNVYRRWSPERRQVLAKNTIAQMKQKPIYQEYLKDRMSIEPGLRHLFDILGRDFPTPKDDEAFRLFLEGNGNQSDVKKV